MTGTLSVRCIICLDEKPEENFSKEHVFPEAIGGSLTIKTVCKPCNDKLGSTVDSALTNHWFIKSERMSSKISGKKEQVPNPIEQGTLIGNPDQKLIYKIDASGTPEQLYSQPSVSRIRNPDGTETVSIRVDASDEAKLPEIVNKIRSRAGNTPLSKEEIDRAKKKQQGTSPRILVEEHIDLIEYKRGVLKTAYELACHWLGEEYLSDPSGTTIRNCILDESPPATWKTKHLMLEAIDFMNNSAIFSAWQGDGAHIGLLMRDGENLVMSVRIFERIEGRILVSTQANGYPRFEDMFISNNPTSGEIQDTTLAKERARLGKNSV
jgi:hypothetical protein